MANKGNVSSEFELYEPMRLWLHQYLMDKYRGFEITTLFPSLVPFFFDLGWIVGRSNILR